MDKKPADHAFAYADNVAIMETFVDGIHMLTVDAETARVVFTVSRRDARTPGAKQVTGKKVTAARLVMPSHTVIALYNELSKLMGALEARGVATRKSAKRTVQ